jgi:hypothetical protein
VSPAAQKLLGVLLFLFIPIVLVLFVGHPEPVGVSLLVGVVLMVGHRFLARPYFERVRTTKCIWCNRVLADPAAADAVEVVAGTRAVRFTACPGHAPPARRFFAWLDRQRLPLRLGIGVPLVALLAALAAVAAGRELPLAAVTDAFRLVVGVTVHAAALGAVLGSAAAPARAVFPLHNFSLLGVRNLLWIFRLVGLWWILAGGRALLATAS